ncbi:MAG TPA: hypothetical protein VIK01_02195 [Polyangiaceae bacterium]
MTLLVAVTAAALSVGACSSDSGGGGGGGGGSPIGMAGAAGDNGGGPTSLAGGAGDNGGGNDAQCVKVNAAYTVSSFLAATTKGGACDNATDAATTCVNDMAVVAGTCGKGCLGMGNDAAQAACVADCVNNSGNLADGSGPLGTECMACYTADVECARKNCLARCGLAPGSVDCADCRYEMGCAQPFYACTGYPDPRATSGGEGGAGGG